MATQGAPIETTAVVVRETPAEMARVEDFMPLMTVAQAVQRKQMVNQFVGQVLNEGEDYGQIAGMQKKVLLKPGAEKLCSIFGIAPQYVEDKIVEDWTGEAHGGEPLFYYSYRCSLSRGGKFMGEAIGSCNSWESKYRYRWVSEDIASQRPDFKSLPKRGGQKTIFEPLFALDKAETTGKYGKPAEYWQRFREAAETGAARRTKKTLGKREFEGFEMTVDETQYRIPNPEFADTINTCQKMAQKRALVAAVLVVTNCSDAFTQDVEDFDAGPPAAAHQPPPDEPDTQAPPPPTAQAQQRQQTPAGAPPAKELRAPQTKRLVPQEIEGVVKRISAQPTSSNIEQACKLLEGAMCQRYGDEPGRAEYARILAAFDSACPRKGRTVGDYVEFFCDLWESISKPAANPGT